MTNSFRQQMLMVIGMHHTSNSIGNVHKNIITHSVSCLCENNDRDTLQNFKYVDGPFSVFLTDYFRLYFLIKCLFHREGEEEEGRKRERERGRHNLA